MSWAENFATLAAVSFGKDVRRLRGARTGMTIAAAALGADSPWVDRRDFRNYLSKIERDKVPNLGLGKLRLLAKGFGYASLAQFFIDLEGGARTLRLLDGVANTDNATLQVESHARSSVPQDDIVTLRATVAHLAFQVEHLSAELARIAADHETSRRRRRERVSGTRAGEPVRAGNARKTR